MKNRPPPLPALICAAFAVLCGASPAWAHAFGARYDLPLPLEYYLVAAGAAVAFSFVIMALAFDSRAVNAKGFWVDLHDLGPARLLAHPAATAIFKTVSVGLLCLVVAAGLFGNQDPARNFAPTFVWIIWWVGLAFTAALVGNFWPAVNPWSGAFDGAEKLARLVGLRGPLSLRLPYPAWLGQWPAIVAFVLFAWFELIAGKGKEPAPLATAILIYSGFTWLGMVAFGRSVWLAHGEAFSLAFAVFGRFAPIGARTENPVPEGHAPAGADAPSSRWGLRPYASALIVTRPCRLTETIFILVMLSTVTFDGFKETPFWSNILRSIALSPSFHPLIRLIHDLGFDYFIILDSAVLVMFPVLFTAVYLAFAWLTKWAAGCEQSTVEVGGLFIYSIVPIAIAYHLAHYLSYLVTAGQLIIPLSSDPFGIGWNLFGTAGYRINIGIIGARFIWYTAGIAIVAGHVYAVGVSHFVALRVFQPARVALRSQYPLLVLMVCYTMVSLWILSQPIVGLPSLNRLEAHADSVTLSPFEFRELCMPLGPGQKIEVTFEADRPVDYNVHFHDGFIIRYPVRLTGVSKLTDRFAAKTDRVYCLMWFNANLKEAALRYRVTGP